MATDFRTLINGMEQIVKSKDMDAIKKATDREAQGLVDAYLDP